jgi:hypothetical protein
VKDQFGHQVFFWFNPSTQASIVTVPGFPPIYYYWDRLAQITGVEYSNGARIDYEYGSTGGPLKLARIKDANKQVVAEWHYDTAGRAILNAMYR